MRLGLLHPSPTVVGRARSSVLHHGTINGLDMRRGSGGIHRGEFESMNPAYIHEPDCVVRMEAMFAEDRGDERVRGTVHGWRMWRSALAV